MNLLDEGESSGLLIQPAKRRRGRPRKDASLKPAGAAHTPGSEGGIAYLSQRTNRTRETECMVGQAVTGFVEATFDSGYLLTVRIGNSSTNLRGVVFKPGHCAPITAENDVAPHAQMIRRSDVRFTFENQSQSPGLGIDMRTSAAVVPSKHKHAPPGRAPAAPSVSAVAPVAPQPITHASYDNGDADVHMVEPLSMLPPVGQVFVPMQPYPSCQVAPGIQQRDDGSFHKGTPIDIDAKSPSQTSDTKIMESLKSSPENSAVVSEQDTPGGNEPFLIESSHTEPLFNYGTGRMTELLKALQENSKETRVQIDKQPTSATQVEFHNSVHKNQDSIL
ncbi:protein METABOLIC NETWORK MODULATOR 1-like [Salvia miltiorrhiza]|uniref:protein METABOLIC NETWORK MODULATOR 1-like n=1 Tax=Salvia miltiorrhiza TaxID=226208 RepID=UPI0025ACC455|nr:protein METABOLIC NETWORK MODULATOR 1-like [Salvia miltiorrhiza]XP_057809816.1 protein METABOLIC NETWORK MODULATOR 1-like [Salvia miltiorrhiza]XP_057809817.1 protein METABOLIC NETWORK MODULATOR 1-like [Salvia miltiorrhiza]XP_057809818.1 protein METABOLIC NETWORK MODULATOR 1-like [Salvia miltiorrhiza]XP_057809819.1 protein METABOLIC NETWORK MODULATOR 1-like [Salvia miltiorrhiza]XP_057809820.1 protein METABOLIC NETWORK MODULATOR 1-like [Salvia miltiorrhiza]